MNMRTNVSSSFAIADSDLTRASQVPGSWMPLTARIGVAVNPRRWQTRAARGLSWHRAGMALRRELGR
jgi:hypothetical protein